MDPESNSTHRRPIVLYDGRCPSCCGALSVLGYLDRDNRIARLDATSIRASPLMATISLTSRGRTVHVLKATGHVKHGGDAVILLLAMLYPGRLGAHLQTRPVTWTLRASYLLLVVFRRYLKMFTSWIPSAPYDNYRNSDWPLLSKSRVSDTTLCRNINGPSHDQYPTS